MNKLWKIIITTLFTFVYTYITTFIFMNIHTMIGTDHPILVVVLMFFTVWCSSWLYYKVLEPRFDAWIKNDTITQISYKTWHRVFPLFWTRNYATDTKWDRELNTILDDELTFESDELRCCVKFSNGSKVWVENFPYAFGTDYSDDRSGRSCKGMSSRKTVIRLWNYLHNNGLTVYPENHKKYVNVNARCNSWLHKEHDTIFGGKK